MHLFTDYTVIWLISVIAVSLIMFMLILVLFIKVNKLKKKMKSMLGSTDSGTLEDAIIQSHQQLSELAERQDRLKQEIDRVAGKTKHMKARTAIIRYNAFHETGSDLSFSIAVIDDGGNGYVLTGIHSRHDSQMYAKPLENGTSKYALSPEEIEAVNQALRS